jgi:hypothetical protein
MIKRRILDLMDVMCRSPGCQKMLMKDHRGHRDKFFAFEAVASLLAFFSSKLAHKKAFDRRR